MVGVVARPAAVWIAPSVMILVSSKTPLRAVREKKHDFQPKFQPTSGYMSQNETWNKNV